jgi:hypothetical protein
MDELLKLPLLVVDGLALVSLNGEGTSAGRIGIVAELKGSFKADLHIHCKQLKMTQ